MIRLLAIFLICLMVAPNLAVQAQTVAPENMMAPEGGENTTPPFRMDSPYEVFDNSLMFTDAELLKIRALLAGVNNELIDETENDAGEGEEKNATPVRRLIQLSGIAYSNPDRWMIWLNGQRLTPGNLLPEIVDLKVYKNYIDLKWFDRGLRKIIKIRMRPNQIYDITSGVMLPG